MKHTIKEKKIMNMLDIDMMANTVLTGIENSNAIWRKSWDASVFAKNRPYNPITKNVYKGLNFFVTYFKILTDMMNDANTIPDYRFCTFKQIQSNKLSLRAGSKGVPIRYWGQKVIENENEPEKTKTRWFVRFSYVFNFKDITIPADSKLNETSTVEYESNDKNISEIIDRLKIKVITADGLQPCFKPNENLICLPRNFTDDVEGMSTVFHEIVHWTSHNINSCKRSLDYAQEELVAEIGAFMLSQYYGIAFAPSNMDNYYAYLKGWLGKSGTREEKLKKITIAIKYATAAVKEITASEEITVS